MTARVHGLFVSPRGGVPKLPVREARVTALGLEGDAVRHPGIHGGPDRALCLYSLERIEALRREGHPIAPGTTGENVTLEGIDFDELLPGDRLRLGAEVVVEVTTYTTPCKTIAGSFLDGAILRISQKERPGWSRVYARVIEGGQLRSGDAVTRPARQLRLP